MEQLSFNQNLAYANGHTQYLPEQVVMSEPAVRSTVKSSVPKSAPSTGNVTEIILPEGQVENFQLLLPMLTQLNQEKRWLAWIDPPQSLVSKWQKMRGIVAGELLVLRSTSEHPAGELAERALSAGTCHAVVMWTKKLSRQSLASLEQASAKGNSHGVVLRQR
ncbi:SulA-like leucine-rich domain-containing protein [Marinobacter sp. CHS3-4]|uniref:cell division inhibitor SulA n=1 Tax=Marinobacter sp. CHS3-4 TaxID=3045174 RepID=UPI0024B487A0|nr:SulA-like leucine-rich domain-containing protein [Marinobacter sp. CHS3-4]MDI9245925.1 SulA-like leucine-rich domain-containing protein [Marinobacter sp. CHS3-4]